jgi:hypothetical protein
LKSAFTGFVNARNGSTSRPLLLSRVEEYVSAFGGFGYSFVPSEKYGDGTIVAWYVAPSAMDVGGSRLLQAVADGFSVMQRLTTTIPVDLNMTGLVYRQCDFFGCRNGSFNSNTLVAGFFKNSSETLVYRSFIGFNLDGVLPENASITKATMTLKIEYITGSPFAADQLTSLAFERMDYGPKVNLDDFDRQPLGCAAGCGFSFYGPPNPVDGPVDVLNYVQTDWAERSTHGYHSQYRLRFANNKPFKANSDQNLSYKHPTLTIEFLVP